MSELYELNSSARLLFETAAVPFNHFYGYYTQSSLSADGRFLLAHRTSFDSRPLTAEDIAEIGYFDMEDAIWHPLAETRALNWQQGSMLQWLGPDFASRVIFNDQEDNRFVARIADVKSGHVETVSPAIYAVHPSGQSAIGVRFERHYFTRAYHYEGIADPKWDVPVHPDDGILSINLSNGQSHLTIHTSQIAEIDPDPSMAGMVHWLEHLLWNPSGTRFSFLHRFGTHEKFTSRLFTANADGTELWHDNSWREWSWSHMGWRDERSLVLFSVRPKSLAKKYLAIAASHNPLKMLLTRMYRSFRGLIPRDTIVRKAFTSGYACIQDGKGMSGMISTGMLEWDGHPNWTKDGRFMLTDTYALDDGYRHLLLYDAEYDRLRELGRFFSPLNACGHRCDLHPRLSRDDRLAIIDTVHTGKRQCMVFEIDWGKIR